MRGCRLGSYLHPPFAAYPPMTAMPLLFHPIVAVSMNSEKLESCLLKLHVAMDRTCMQEKDLRYFDIFLNVEDELALSKVGLYNFSRCPHSNSWIQWPLQIAEGDAYVIKIKRSVAKLGYFVLCAIMAFDSLTHNNRSKSKWSTYRGRCRSLCRTKSCP